MMAILDYSCRKKVLHLLEERKNREGEERSLAAKNDDKESKEEVKTVRIGNSCHGNISSGRKHTSELESTAGLLGDTSTHSHETSDSTSSPHNGTGLEMTLTRSPPSQDVGNMEDGVPAVRNSEEATRTDNVPSSSPRKFTISKRIESALRLLEQGSHSSQDLIGRRREHIETEKLRSASMPTDIGIEASGMGMGPSHSNVSGMGIGLSSSSRLGTSTSKLGIGKSGILSDSSRKALHQELGKIQMEEDERRLQHMKSTRSPRGKGEGLEVPSLPASPRKSPSLKSNSQPAGGRHESSVNGITQSQGAHDDTHLSPRDMANPATDRKPNENPQKSPQKRPSTESQPNQSASLHKSQPHQQRDDEDSQLHAMASLVESRGREEMAAQLSRERKSHMISPEELAKVHVATSSIMNGQHSPV